MNEQKVLGLSCSITATNVKPTTYQVGTDIR